jgi:hypothetical protein
MQLLKLLNRNLQCKGSVITVPGSPTAAASEAGSHHQVCWCLYGTVYHILQTASCAETAGRGAA